MPLEKKAVSTTAGEGLDALLQNLIRDNPAMAMELLNKLRGPAPEPENQQIHDDPWINKDFRNFGTAADDEPKAVKITIMEMPNESKWVSLKLGDKPRVHVVRGIPWIIPKEYLSILDDAVIESFEHIPRMTPDPVTGNVFDKSEFRRMRCPYTNHGDVPWHEYEAFIKKLAQTGGKKD